MSLVLALDGGLTDKSVNRTAFSLVGGVVPGDLGYKHNGQTGYVLNSTPSWRSADSLGTIIAWINPGAIGSQQVIFGSSDKDTNFQNYLFFILLATNKLSFGGSIGGGGRGVDGSTTFIANQWRHVAVVSSGTAWSLSVDGVAEALTVPVLNDGTWWADVSSRDSNSIGGIMNNSAVTQLWTGDISVVRVYDEVFTQTMLLDDYESTRYRY